MQALINQLIGKRYLLALLTLMLGAAVTYGMTKSSINAGFESILSEDDPYKAEVDQAREDFPPSTSVLFAFQTDTHIFTFPALRAMDALTQRYTEVESAISVGSLLNRRLNADDEETLDRLYLIPELSELTEADLVEIKAVAMADEDLIKSIMSPQADMALANIKFKAPEDTQEARLSIARSVVKLRLLAAW